MSAQHTPGPWIARHMHGKDEFAVFWYDSAFANRERQTRVDNRCGEFKEADARLIAAAPDLLSAAKAVAFSNGFDAGLPDKLKALCTAISKATGEQP